VNSHPDPTGLRARRTWWPSAASCAFTASGQEIVSFGLGLYVSSAAAREHAALLNIEFMIAEFMIAVIGTAAAARALWGVGQRQQAVAPVSARLGQWAVATFVVVSGLLLFVLMTAEAFGVWTAGGVGNWVFQVPLIPLTLAFGCLGWASRGDSGPRQRWASGGLLVVAMFSVFSVIWARFGLQTGQHWLWLASLHTALDAATWAAVGAWLRTP
jgi:hypothetical protein